MQERTPNSLYDPRIEQDACGTGFVADLANVASHEIVQTALEALSRLAHRGASAADEASGDGAGLLLQLPVEFFRSELSRHAWKCAEGTPIGVAMLFCHPARRAEVERALAAVAEANWLRVAAWRDVPVCESALGAHARHTLPSIVQAILTPALRVSDSVFERALQFARTQLESAVAADDVYVCSLSSRSIVYKALCNADRLGRFYPDLADSRLASALAVFHQRFATNTQPSWALVQPFRLVAHNGEINTLRGNRKWLQARLREAPEEHRVVLRTYSSDSALLDDALEMLMQEGRSLAGALSAMIVPAWETQPDRYDGLAGFYRANAALVEPWDGPAALMFSDGRVAGAALDRNGLRPCRYCVSRSGRVVAASEAGVVDFAPEEIAEMGRLGPGEMLLADLATGRLLHDPEIKNEIAQGSACATSNIRPLAAASAICLAESTPADTQTLRTYGYSREDLQVVLASMARDGKEAVWSMGDDTPVSAVSRFPRSLYSMLRQRFAQVTNPAIDSLRERMVMSLTTWLGTRPGYTGSKRRSAKLLELPSPVLSGAAFQALCRQRHLQIECLPALFNLQSQSVPAALGELAARAERAVVDGAALLVLSDRGATPARAPLSLALAVGAVHHQLLRSGLHLRADLVAEAGDCFDVHHVAVLIALGARAVHPWLAAQAAIDLAGRRGEQTLVEALEAGLLKVMAKIGISTAAGYCGGEHLEALGLSAEVAELCFPEARSPLGGLGFADLEAGLRERHAAAFAGEPSSLSDHGLVRFRRDGEHHAWTPTAVRLLQSAAGSARSSAPQLVPLETRGGEPTASDPWEAHDRLAASHPPMSLRDLLALRATPPIPLERVEPAEQIVQRFVTSAMSLGALSPEAHRTIAIAMNRLGARSNSGEGGEDPDTYAETEAQRRCDNKIKQIASGRFGVTAGYIARAEELEIKIAQGSKPGEGGQIPASKVTGLIARLRHAKEGIALISPPPHHDIYSIEDLAQLIYDLRRCNPLAQIGVKLVAQSGVGTVAAGVAKARADYIVIAGHAGGTGASPLSSIKHAGLPWELGLAETQQALVSSDLRGRVRLRVDGGVRSGRDVLMAALLGAEEFAFGTAALVALGCDMARQCHLNTCPSGIATQRPELRARFRGAPENLISYLIHVAEDVRGLLAQLGLDSLESAVGRCDLLEQARFDGGFDLSPLLARPQGSAWRCVRSEVRSEPAALEDSFASEAAEAAAAGRSFRLDTAICNRDRAVGARVAGELVRQLPVNQPAPGLADLVFTGVAGQSFGAWCTAGIRLTLTGEANDYVGKGLCGGEIRIRPHPSLRTTPHPAILGNVALYGATSGWLFVAGAAGERFAVRNSGASAVVEGVGYHGCEYMTGGRVVVLGAVGANFGAGMTGGTAFVLDPEGLLPGFLNHESVQATALTAEEDKLLIQLLEWHYAATESPRALHLLLSFKEAALDFRAVRPRATVPAQTQWEIPSDDMKVRATG